MDLSLEKFTKKQKIIGALVIFLIIAAIILLISSQSIPQTTSNVEQPTSMPQPVEEKPNDLSRDDGLLIDETKYPNPNFPALKLSDVFGNTKAPHPPLQYNGQPRVFLDCGRLISDNAEFQKIIKKACVARLVSDGTVAVLGGDTQNDYIYYRGKTRGDHTITLIHDISTLFEKTYLIYEYDYITQSSNYIDRISLVDPKKYYGDAYDYNACPYDKIQTYSDPKCLAEGDSGKNGNTYFLESKDRYFRDVNLP